MFLLKCKCQKNEECFKRSTCNGVIRKNYQYSKYRNCFCDEKCQLYSDCCEDIEDKFSNNRLFVI